MDLAQLSGCAFCYLELKYGKEYATMEMTKSEQIRADLQKSFQSGLSTKALTVCYGYQLISSVELVVYPMETVIVFYIFERFEVDDSLGKISAALADMEIISPSGKVAWIRETISEILANELDSLSAQERYYEKRIKAKPNWKFAGIYSDIGSGITIKRRKRFHALVSACRFGKVDMVLIKSAHQLARNTVDALETIRMLRRWKVSIYFEADDIHTL